MLMTDLATQDVTIIHDEGIMTPEVQTSVGIQTAAFYIEKEPLTLV